MSDSDSSLIKTKNSYLLMTIFVFCILCTSSSANSINKCVDGAGKVTYTNGPCSSAAKHSEELDIKITKIFFREVVPICRDEKKIIDLHRCINTSLKKYTVNYDSNLSAPFADEYIRKLAEIAGRVNRGEISDSAGRNNFYEFTKNLDQRHTATFNEQKRRILSALKTPRQNPDISFSERYGLDDDLDLWRGTSRSNRKESDFDDNQWSSPNRGTAREAPSTITNCDEGGCWDNLGKRYTRGAGSTYFPNTGGSCQVVGGQMQCP